MAAHMYRDVFVLNDNQLDYKRVVIDPENYIKD